MDSPFLEFVNSVLYVSVPGDSLEIDPRTGNRMPSTEKIEIRALLKPQAKDPKLFQMPGADSSQVYVKGWLCDPPHWPEGVTPPITVDAIALGRKGKLSVNPKIAKAFGVEEYTGEAIEGWFNYG